MTKKPAKKCARQPDYHAKNSWYASILPKNQRLSEKRKAEIDVHKYPYRSSNLFSGLLEKKRRYLIEIRL